MRTKTTVLLCVLAVGIGMALVVFRSPSRPAPDVFKAPDVAGDSRTGSSSPSTPKAEPVATAKTPSISAPATLDRIQIPAASASKLERLAKIRESFRSLAAGEAGAALRAAKQLTNGVERETALMSLVTEWTQGALSSPGQRAWNIARYGLEAGLGMELTRNPELALAWANELTEGQGRLMVIQSAATGLLDSDPSAAFALSAQLPQEQQQTFTNAVFASWAQFDTEAALDWANRLDDPAAQDSAVQSIRSVAPVGIGAALTLCDGYPVVGSLLPGTPAHLGGQLQPGDRILAVAQDGAAFVDTKGLPLQDIVNMIRGTPGSLLQLQVQSSGNAPDTTPRSIWIVRDQIKFKTGKDSQPN